jgi:hypothetical protein
LSNAKNARRVWLALAGVLLLVTALSVLFIAYKIDADKQLVTDPGGFYNETGSRDLYLTNTAIMLYINATTTAKAWTKMPTPIVTPD